jgi:glycine dehydrogenase subunit 1
MDVVNVPTYDGFQASSTALLMSGRITGRSEVLICGTISQDKLSKINDYIRPHLKTVSLKYLPESGLVDLSDLKAKISPQTAAVFFENPSYLGFLETQASEIADLAHQHGALCVVYVDPISLGVINPPAEYGGDIACGDIQPLGMHMNYGGGHGGFIATQDNPTFVQEFPSRLFGVSSTIVEGEYGFGDVAYERTSFALREEGKEWVGTASALWGITAGVYLALMGPQGMVDIGNGILQRTAYAIQKLKQVQGVKIPFSGIHFRDFVVDFNETSKTVADINQQLLMKGIFGGKDLNHESPVLGQCALYAVTEIHTQADIDRLAVALQEVLR